MEYWKHPSQGRVQEVVDKHPEKKDFLKSQGWSRIKGRDDWAPFEEKKQAKKVLKRKRRSNSTEIRSRSR